MVVRLEFISAKKALALNQSAGESPRLTHRARDFIKSLRRTREPLTVRFPPDWWLSLEKTSRTDDELAESAAAWGRIDILAALKEEGVRFSPRTYECAAWRGCIPAFDWLREGGVEWDDRVTGVAAREGHIAFLAHAFEADAPRSSNMVSSAAMEGRVDTIEWLDSQGFSLTVEDARMAAWHGQLPVLELLYYKGVEWSYELVTAARISKQTEVIEWVNERWEEENNNA